MYRSRKATAVFQRTNPWKEERFMKEWQVSKPSPLTKVYTQYSTWRKMTSTPVLRVFVPPFTLQLIWGRNRGVSRSRFHRCWQPVGSPTWSRAQNAPQKAACRPGGLSPVTIATRDHCTLMLLAWMHWSSACDTIERASAPGLTQQCCCITTLRTSPRTRPWDQSFCISLQSTMNNFLLHVNMIN